MAARNRDRNGKRLARMKKKTARSKTGGDDDPGLPLPMEWDLTFEEL